MDTFPRGRFIIGGARSGRSSESGRALALASLAACEGAGFITVESAPPHLSEEQILTIVAEARPIRAIETPYLGRTGETPYEKANRQAPFYDKLINPRQKWRNPKRLK